MCGICGWISKNNSIDLNLIKKMNSMVSYRGPDDSGTWTSETVALAHRRLAIIDVSKAGHQPFEYSDIVLTFNGEIYNYIELREELKELGYSFQTNTDVEVLAASYCEWKEDCVSHFNGMWSFALYDKCRNIVLCSRDRFGVKPFYYIVDDKKLCFASEIKQLLPALGHRPKANKDALAQFIVRGNLDYSEFTCFEGVVQLQPGTNMIYDISNSSFELQKYYDLSRNSIKSCTFEDSAKGFLHDFCESVMLRLRADVPIGFCLSGGLDSSAIASVANYIDTKHEMEWHTVSACYKDEIYDEQEYIDEVNKAIDAVSHKTYPDGSELFKELDNIIWHMDEPFGSTSIFAQWCVFKEAKDKNITVMLDGQGADEQLCGYTSIYAIRFADLLMNFKLKTFIREWREYKKLRASTEKYLSSTMLLLNTLARSILSEKRYYLIREKAIIKKSGSLFKKETLDRAFRIEPKPKGKGVKEFIDYAISTVLVPLFHYEDRNSMAFSIESRLPFMDYQLVESVYKMPFDHKISGGVTKVVLREGLKGILPEKIRLRYSKLGFETPENKWMTNDIDTWRDELLLALDSLESFVNKESVLNYFERNSNCFKRGDFSIWRIICASHWLKVFDVEV